MADRSSSSNNPATGLSGWLRRMLGGRNGESLRETVGELLDDYEEGGETLSDAERSMLVNLLEFGELRVDDVMVPRADVVAVDEQTPLAEVVELVRKVGHSRLPVYRETLDDPIGMIHVRDLLDHWGTEPPGPPLATLARRVLFVPPSMPVVDLLIKMRTARLHMALVVDEYGGIDGLATIEDLVEPIVGEIWDEHDTDDAQLLIERPGGLIEAQARASVEELEQMTGCDLLPDDREEDVDTVGGLVYAMLGRIPARGEVIAHESGLEFEVVDADPRRIKRLRVRRATSRA
ncbi:MAG: hemolysin family protein [Alphaproteobacteria bacterium]|jgi:magnesium and cobalt transporter|nr:HlyC/CorC family transporter [Rhodospirillaceae bacterium]MBT6510135.1 HlyC/CorC family transporter [Rhodospirillaceae bacterium]MBT7646283.1 HlyC/CorC family transporter [Rhodospirillaceae bacterium]MDG2482502.1 hemolysin family protein [Alphaproteobacteria bacterium]